MFTTKPSTKAAATLVLLVCALGTTVTLGQAQHTPSWWNNNDGRTFRESYGFTNNVDPPDSTPGITPPFYPHIGTIVDSDGDAGWLAGVGGHDGAWGVQGAGKKGSVTFFVWNSAASDSEKHLWCQFDCYVQNGGVGDSAKAGPPAQSAGAPSIPNHWEDLGNGWTRHWREWTIKPQPAWEEITFTMATAESGGTAAIDNVQIGAHCDGQGVKCDASGFDFGGPTWPPVAVFVCVPPEHEGFMWWSAGNPPPEWMPLVGDHEGVIGLPGGMLAQGELLLWIDGLELPDEVVHIDCQFDFYMEAGGMVRWMPELPPESLIENVRETYFDIGGGWQRCLLQLDASPPPAWRAFHWFMNTDPGSGPVAVDNILVSAGTVVADDWFDDFDFYPAETPLHGVYGWKGWDNDPAYDGFVTDVAANSPLNSLEVAGPTDLVQEFTGFDAGVWRFAAWQYIPAEFQSGGVEPFAGTFVVMLNTYEDGGPHEESDWSVQMQFDSFDHMLKVYHGQGLDTINVPYQTDRWVELQVVIDLRADWTQVLYDGLLVAEYPWTGGVLGGGGGAANVAALDLFANGSTPVYYDDVRLWPAYASGDVNNDGNVDNFDISPFVYALTHTEAEFEAAFPEGSYWAADVNSDGNVDNFDITPFVELLTND